MHRFAFLVALLALAVSGASAQACVKIRKGDGGHTCMKFSEVERKHAGQLGLRLGSPYASVLAHLSRNGWRIDREWLEELETESKPDLPVCGQGWDATCHLQMKKGAKVIELDFSGTNPGLPLIYARPAP